MRKSNSNRIEKLGFIAKTSSLLPTLLAGFAPRWLTAFTDPPRALADGLRQIGEKLVTGSLPFRHTASEEWFSVGTENIDWSGAHRAHQEWRAQLNRFFQLADLAWLFLDSGDERFARTARSQVLDWITQHPADSFRLAPSDNTLNLAIRLGSSHFPGWLGSLPFLQKSAVWNDATTERVIHSVVAQLDFLTDNLTSHGNWRIAQADCLLFAALTHPELPGAKRWLQIGVETMNEAMRRQFLPDGAHWERNPHYHGWMVTVMSYYWHLGQRDPSIGLEIATDMLVRMFRYAMAHTAPDGGENGLHDTHQQVSGEKEPVIPSSISAAATSREAMIREFMDLSGVPRDEIYQKAAFFPVAGQVCVRDGWTKDSAYLVFDATTWGGSHCHLGRNGLQFDAHGQRMLRDPGLLSYEASEPAMAHGKSTRAHNTVNLNGWNQHFANPTRTRFASGLGRHVMTSCYEGGYWSGDYTWHFETGLGLAARHHRTVFWHEGRFAVVIDWLQYYPGPDIPVPSIECNWQFDRSKVEIDDPAGRFTARFAESRLDAYIVQRPEEARIHLHEGEQNPLRGWLTGSEGLVAAPQVTVEATELSDHYARYCTVLVPGRGDTDPGLDCRFWKPDPDLISALELKWPDGTQDFLEWTDRLEFALAKRPYGTTAATLVHRHCPAVGSADFAGWSDDGFCALGG